MTGHGGWPMTVFLTPDGRAVLRRHVLPAARLATGCRASARCSRRSQVRGANGARTSRAPPRSSSRRCATRAACSPRPTRSRRACSAGAARGLRHGFDPEWGGWGARRSSRPRRRSSSCSGTTCATGDEESLAMATATLDGMALGGMYDLLGGGFHRYSVDERWLVPHFEKMLYDNALLVPGVPARLPRHRPRALSRDRRGDGGVHAAASSRSRTAASRSAQDADTDGVEGLTFTWTEEEGVPADLLEPFEHGRSVIRGDSRRRSCDGASSRSASCGRSRCATTRRSRRGTGSRSPRWRRRAGGSSEPDWVDQARVAGEFLLTSLSDAGRAPAAEPPRGPHERRRRTSTTTRTSRTACSSCTSRRASCAGSRRRSGSRGSRSTSSRDDERGGFFSPRRGREPLVARRSRSTTTRCPPGTRCSRHVLLRLARIYGDDELERRAVSVFRLLRPALERAPSAFGWALCALQLWFSPPRELAIVGDLDDDVARAALDALGPGRRRRGRACRVRCRFWRARARVDGRTAVYVCERFACRAPVTQTRIPYNSES